MKIKKLALLLSSILLSSCSLGAETVSKDEFKRILNDEIKPTVIESIKTSKDDYTVIEGRRNVSLKTYIETTYSGDTADYDMFFNEKKLDQELLMMYSKTITSYATKEIITSAGVKAFSDVEKVIDIEDYALINTEDHHLKTVKDKYHTLIRTDYLSIELDTLTGRISTAEIIVDDNIFEFGSTKITYDKFTEKDDSEEEEEEDIENPVISLAGTEWTLEDTVSGNKKSVVTFVEDLDKIASKNVVVGTIVCGEETHELFIFEKGDGSYNFEVRETTQTEESTILSDVAYDKSVSGFIETVITPEVNNYFALASVTEWDEEVVESYASAFNFIKDTIDSNKTIEILKRVSGIAYRVNDNGDLKEAIVSKLDEETKTRRITDVAQRHGFNGNEIYTYEFLGF